MMMVAGTTTILVELNVDTMRDHMDAVLKWAKDPATSLDAVAKMGRFVSDSLTTGIDLGDGQSTDPKALKSANYWAAMVEELRVAYRGRSAGSVVTRPSVVRNDPSVVSPVQPVAIPEGTYTVEFSGGDYFTFRVTKVESGNLAGKTILEFLSGPDNSTDFQGFAFLNGPRVKVWGRFEKGDLVQKARIIEQTFIEGKAEEAGVLYAMRSGRCRRCGRKLTVPASLHRGYGPDCAAIIGG